MKLKFNESQWRSISKAAGWRVMQTFIHAINGFIVSGSFIMALNLAGVAAIVNTFWYWAHERTWNTTKWQRVEDLKVVFNERWGRSAAKLVTWRILMLFSNFFIGYITTGSWAAGLAFMSLATLFNVFIYFFYERIWNRAKWGKSENKEPEVYAVAG